MKRHLRSNCEHLLYTEVLQKFSENISSCFIHYNIKPLTCGSWIAMACSERDRHTSALDGPNG